MRKISILPALLLVPLFVGCISDKMVADTGLGVARRSSIGIETVQDFEVGEKMVYSGLAQLETLHVASPRNADGLFLLVRGWTAVGQAFIHDEYEQALLRKDDPEAAYQRRRERAAFERAKRFGVELLALRAGGFAEASRNHATLSTWLTENFTDKERAVELLWIGAAWLGRIVAESENTQVVADLWIGVALVEHAAHLDETAEFGLAHVILGAYHARGAIAEIEESKQHFDRARAINGGRYLLTQLQLAERYYCLKHDKRAHDAALEEILGAKDPLPEARLTNVVAKRFAFRHQTNKLFQEECGFEL